MQSAGVNQNGTSRPANHGSTPETNHIFRCGHPRSEDNLVRCGNGRVRCRTCKNDVARPSNRKAYHALSREDRWLNYRFKMLPSQLENARRRVAHLEAEAARLGIMTEAR